MTRHEAAFERLCRFAERRRRALGIPGAALGLEAAGRRFIRGLGVPRAGSREAVTGDTLFQVGSITKTFTATLLLRLREEGRLDLDEPVRAYLPELRLADRRAAASVTTRHLLTHTGGWAGDFFADTGRGDDALRRILPFLGGLPQLTPVGSVWAYNNAGFYLAGRLAEVLFGGSFEAVAARRLFEPLGMSSSVFFAEDVIGRPFALGHNVSRGRAEAAAPWAMARSAHPAGGAVSCAADLLRFASAQMRPGFLRGGTLREARSPQAPAGSGVDAMGLAWMLRAAGGLGEMWHGGATNGQTAHLSIIPERGFALAVLTNADVGGTLIRSVRAKALEEFLGVEPVSTPSLRLPEPALARFKGRYEAQLAARELRASDGGLTMLTRTKGGFPRQDSPPLPAPPPARLVFIDQDKVALDGASGPFCEGEFLRDRKGRIAWFRFAGRLHVKRD